MKTKLTTALVMLSIFTILGATAGSSQSAPVDTGEWEYQLAPFFFWGLSLDGEMTVRGQTQEVQMDFDEILDSTEALFTVHFEAWKDGWGLFLEGSYIGISDRQETPEFAIDIDLDIEMLEFGGMKAMGHSAAFLWGVRYIGLDPVIRFESFPLPVEKIDESQGWMDPIVGLVWRPSLGEKWYLASRVDIGGFGFQSDFAWNAVLAFAWRMKPSIDLLFGYRAMDYDFEEEQDGFAFDALMSGPLMAFNFRF